MLKVTEERSRIQSWIRIGGSGFASKSHGSPALVVCIGTGYCVPVTKVTYCGTTRQFDEFANNKKTVLYRTVHQYIQNGMG